MSDITDTFHAATTPPPPGESVTGRSRFPPKADPPVAEQTAPTAATPVPLGESAPVALPAVRVSARDLVHVAQGLYFIFWGLLISIVAGTQILATLWLRTFAELFLAAGVLATLVGSWRLTQARLDGLRPAELSRRWRVRTRWIFWLAMLLAYFCVLFFMWRRAVDSTYLQVNALVFVGVGICYLILLSRTVAALALGLGNEELALESRLFNASNIGLLLLPFLGALGYVAVMAIRRESDLLDAFNLLLGQLNTLTALVFLLPLSLTLAVVWAAKDMALRRLGEVDAGS